MLRRDCPHYSDAAEKPAFADNSFGAAILNVMFTTSVDVGGRRED